MSQKEKREIARGVLLYLEERGQKVDDNIANMHSFPKVIMEVLDEYADVFNTHLSQ